MAFTAAGSGGPRQAALDEYMARVSAGELLAIVASDPSGVGIVVSVHLPKRTVLSELQRTTLARFSMHVWSAYRYVRTRTRSRTPTFRPDGRVVHVLDEVKEAGATAQLREVVLAAAKLRQGVDGDEDPFEGLTSRVRAQWSVLARFSEGADEFVVARRNAAPSFVHPLLDGLSPRERQVVSYLALGHSPKAVSYELGIAHSTVRVLVSRALVELGVESVAELIRGVVSRSIPMSQCLRDA
ncbi:hypothetical protein BH09MYX1_BH09MYX1_45380 [soil metagenome]